MFVKVLCLILSSQWVLSQDQMTIGGIFYGDDPDDLKTALSLSAQMYNYTASVREVSKRGEVLEITESVCSLAGEGVLGIIDGTGGRASEHIQALCDMMELPHVIVQHNDLYARNWSLLNLYPSSDAFNMAIEKLITIKGWNNFTILFVKGHSLNRVNKLMQMGNDTDRCTVTVRELSGDDYRDVLINAKENDYSNFVVDCPSRRLKQLLRHAQQVGLMADEHSYIFVSPDLFTLDMSRYRYGGVNMTGFRLVHLSENQPLWDFTKRLNNETGKDIAADQLKTQVILIHDAVKVFYEALKKLGPYTKPSSLSCEKNEAWSHGSSVMNFMRTNRIEGLTRTLLFDGLGQRTDVIFDVLELTPAGNQTIGTWQSNDLNISRPFVPEPELDRVNIMRNKTFKILVAETPPYTYIKESAEELEGNDRFEGFAIDLIDRLSEMLGFSYEFELEKDYGKFNKETKKWDGMVLALREEKADFAICDLTITFERQSGIDFSTPFMTLGIGILYKEPSKQPPEMFSFMAVFSKEVWYYMLFVQLGVGAIMIFVGRLSHSEWQNPVPCIEQPEELRNQFSFANSIWLIIGSVMQQGSEIAPIALAPRMITSVWWFFTMVMVASYVGTLVAFLTVEKNVMPFNNVYELAEQKSIKYGAKEVGSTISFFQDSTDPVLKKIYERMKAERWLVGNNNDGVNRVSTENYAFFTESTSIEYYQERYCDLMQIGGLLDSKSYGIGMKKESPYKNLIDDALLKMKEKGEIQKMKNLWWKEKRGGGKCEVKGNDEPKQLGMKNMLGAFVVLGVGCCIGLVISILDMLWGVFKRSVKYKTTFKYELVEELKFALKFSGDIKPVRRPPRSDQDSAEPLDRPEEDPEAKGESKDELASLRSIPTIRSARSGRSSSASTAHSRHSHCSSRHSGLSMAFARRRKYS